MATDRRFAVAAVGSGNRTEHVLSPGSHAGWRSLSYEMPKMCETCDISHYRYHRERQAPGIPLLRRARPAAPGPTRRVAGTPSIGEVAKKLIVNPPGSLREPSAADKQVCPVCQIKFPEFRNSGRLGCPYDYEVFRDELMPLLESIHGETRHSGKVPKRAPRNTQQQTTLIQLRNELKRAVAAEDYETAARLRDKIRSIEQDQVR